MTTVCFLMRDNELCGFELSGHSGAGEAGYDIVCAAVSSAAYMTVNTLTDVIMAECEVEVDDGFLKAVVMTNNDRECGHMLKGFKLHMQQLCEQYPKNIRITTTQI